jgi:glycosyltransferase involved in cell wall biosynthesis
VTPPDQDIAFAERAIIYGGDGGQHALKLSEAARAADVSVVIDVYDLETPVHPEGHLGWWKFPVAELSDMPKVRLTLVSDQAEVSVDELRASDAWLNPSRLRTPGLIVNAVLRSNTSNAIVAIDRVPAFPNEADLTAFRSTYDRDWTEPRYAASPFIPGTGETIHIVSPNIFPRDAVGELCLELYRMLRQNGIPVRLHAQHCDLSINDLVEPEQVAAAKIGRRDQIVYFYSTYDPLIPRLVESDCARKIAYFHGITNPSLLRVFDPELSVVCAKAIEALPSLAEFDLLAANSRHSARILAEAVRAPSPDRVNVLPPQLLAASGPASGGGGVPRRNALMTVAQLRPHKRLEDVLRLFAAYRQIDGSAECWIVGRPTNRAYLDYLGWVERHELGLPAGAVRWYGSVSEEELAGLYKSAAAYVSMSEDEGFCLPIFEAMRNELLVLAYGIPAVAETMGAAGLRFGHKDFASVAQYLAELRADPDRHDAIVTAQSRRASELSQRMSGAEFFALVAPEHVGPTHSREPARSVGEEVE